MATAQADQADSFVREIVDHSGLLTRISEEDEYIFAHRSIHEYLIALQLSRDAAKGASALLARANDALWRQVIMFFVSLDHSYVDSFLKDLSQVNLELAGHCLSVARVLSVSVARETMELLEASAADGGRFKVISALVMISQSAKDSIRDESLAAIGRILRAAIKGDVSQLAGLKPEDLIIILERLSLSYSSNVVQACLEISRMIRIVVGWSPLCGGVLQ